MKKAILVILVLSGIQNITAQSEDALIRETLTKYIDGSTGGQPKLLKEAFHPDLNLYYVKNDTVRTWSGNAYIADTKEGKPTGETGKILSIDYTNDAAMAKVEIAYPGKTPYIDYFMLLKTNDKWTIVHKMFTKKTK
ncbi:nuclear transport factor 2 family protein [Aureibaculum conchae]|uniref:nuclear transport factor 2 family protein n=1 Tax=Aureibaculum sp. 2308TA14-22 TaxID=3108392 RepID=UPI00339087DE